MRAVARLAFLGQGNAFSDCGAEHIFTYALQIQPPGHVDEHAHFDGAFRQRVVQSVASMGRGGNEFGNISGPADDAIFILGMVQQGVQIGHVATFYAFRAGQDQTMIARPEQISFLSADLMTQAAEVHGELGKHRSNWQNPGLRRQKCGKM
jgi:hypothetical protein